MNTKHINILIFSNRPRDEQGPVPNINGTKRRFYCIIQQKTATLSQGGSRFVPGTRLVCSRHSPFAPDTVPPKMFMCLQETKIEPKPFFLKLCGRPRISRQNPGISRPKSLVSLGFEGHTELFGPHPFAWKTPTPPEEIRTKKFRFGFFLHPAERAP